MTTLPRGATLAGSPAILLLCFFLSGTTGLVYEVVWLRMLGLVFGHTVYAITTVLAAFMAGLGLGSFLFGRVAPRIRNGVRVYGYLEIAIGLACALVPFLLWLTSLGYLWAHRALGLSYDAFSLVQFLLVFTLLLVPTTLMGGTLPVLSQALAAGQATPWTGVGVLYAVNTFGAVVGVSLAGYVLLPAFGNRTTTVIAVLANLAVGALAIAYTLQAPAAAARPTAPAMPPGAPPSRGAKRSVSPPPEAAPRRATGGPWLTVAALSVSGAVSMLYEVAWTRALALVIGSSTYAFTAMLVAFLVGIAGGSALFSWWRGGRPASPLTFAAIQVGIAALVLGVLLAFERLPEVFLLALRWSDAPGAVQLFQLVASASVLLPSTLLIGATFPCAVAVVSRVPGLVGRDVGFVYAVNTLGAIAGTLVTGFVLIPAIGVHASIRAGIAVNVLVGAALVALAARSAAWRLGSVPAALVAASVVAAVPAWDVRVMASGPAIYGKYYLKTAERQSLANTLRGQRILYYRDGMSATVSVDQAGPHIFLRVNGKMDAGTDVDMPTQLMSGHLPLLFHRDPKSVLVIGLGSGITAGAVSRHPIDRLDVVEIEPAVVEASRFFAPLHGSVLSDPRVRVVIADGRNYLLTTPRRYDVIVSEPSNPWIGGLASLFSVELFRLARERLEPGGIMLQWLQGYGLHPDDLRMVVKTFRTVFPATSIWNTIPGDFLLIGQTEPAPIDLGLLQARYETNPGVWGDLERIQIRAWPGVLGYFMLGHDDAARLTESAGLNTDDRLPLEFSAPRALYVDTTNRNWQLVRSYRTAALPAVTPASEPWLARPGVRHAIGLAYLLRDSPQDALLHFQEVLGLDPDYVPSLLGASAAFLRLGNPADALDLALRIVRSEPGNAAGYFRAGLAAEALGRPSDAVALLSRAVALQPDNAEVRTALARIMGR